MLRGLQDIVGVGLVRSPQCFYLEKEEVLRCEKIK